MGGSKKSTRDVYDYLMSLDYGVCHGPVDTITQVTVKDKPIFCGAISERTDEKIDLADLYGGDDGEGGPVGTVEVYTGTDDQLMSDQLAGRFGLTPTTAPGYRGLAHLFFRGPGNSGFRWTTNNPYMPPAKVSLTRLPKTLNDTTSRIYPFSHYDETTNEPTPYFDFLSYVTPTVDLPGVDLVANEIFNLTDFLPVKKIDGGCGQFVLSMSAYAQNRLNQEPIAGVITGSVTYYGGTDGGGGALVSYPSGGQDNGNGQLSFNFTSPIPSGARSMRVQTGQELLFPFWSDWINIEVHSEVNADLCTGPGTGNGSSGAAGSSFGGHCDLDGDGLAILPNANPSHIIHECLVNTEWGKGEDPLNIDVASFEAAASTLFDEFFGLAMLWTRQTEIESFVQEVLDHIQGMLFQNPQTGKWTLKLLRDDYDAASEPLLDPSNCKATKRRRKAWGETINEIVVEYTDPRTEKSATVASHNLANIAIQGGVLSEKRPYFGIRDPWLAQVVADRDVLSSGYPLFSCVIDVDRTQWNVVPGAVRRFSWPEDGIEDMVVRVMRVNYGTAKKRTIRLEVVEDVFALEQTAYGDTQATQWVSDRSVPVPLTAEMAMTTPLPVLLRNGVALPDLDAAYPSVGVALLGWNDEQRVMDFEAHTTFTLANGGTAIKSVNTVPPSRSVLTDVVIAAEAETIIPGATIEALTISSAQEGDFLLLGESEASHEIVMLDSFDALNDEWHVARGIYDTLPVAWPVGTRLWVFPNTGSRVDPAGRAAGETIIYRFLPRVSEGRLAYDEAADVSFTATARPHLPFRPADCQIDGNGFALTDYTQGPPPATITATWVDRNRTVEDQIALRWGDATTTPEAGQTTVLVVRDEDHVVRNEITGLTGTSYGLVSGDFAGTYLGYLEFWAEIDGVRSLMAAKRWFNFSQGGWDQGWGDGWGGREIGFGNNWGDGWDSGAG